MKTHTIESHVERCVNPAVGAAVIESTFTIKATSKAFDILSGSLYSNKVQAIVRELSCNAYDSHVAAGKKDLPIEIHLPTSLDPTFYVKDFGIGLSHEQIAGKFVKQMKGDGTEEDTFVPGIYQTFFDSNKQDSDDFIGALGLGSKSPFSYTSQFMVEARYDGIKRTYTMFKNEKGLPAVSLMGETPTDECNGLTVTLSVRTGDVEKFHTAAKKALMYFDPKPNVIGRNFFEAYHLIHTVTGSNWKIRENDYYADMHGPYVVQGFVAYPIASSLLREHNLSDAAASLCEVNLDLFVDIGKVEPAPSREALSYDPRTIINLIAVLEDAAAEMRQSFQTEFDKCATPWEVAMLIDKFEHGQSQSFGNIFKKMHTEKPFTWKDTEATDSIMVDMTNIKNTTMCRVYLSGRKGTKINYSGKWEPTTIVAKYDLKVQGGLHIIIDRDSKGNGDVLRQFLVNEDNKTHINGHDPAIILIRPIAKNMYNQQEIDSLVEMFGQPTAEYIDNLGLTKTKTKSSYTKRDNAVKMVWKGFPIERNRHGRRSPRCVFSRLTWTSETIDLNAGGLYVPVERFTIIRPDKNECCGFDGLLENAIALGLLDKNTKIIGLNEKEQAQVQKIGNWVNLFNELTCNFELANDNNMLINRAVIEEVYHQIGSDVTTQVINPWASISGRLNDGAFKTYFNKLAAFKKTAADVSEAAVTSVAHQLNISLDVVVEAKKLHTEWLEVIAKYEMLNLIDWDQVGYAHKMNLAINYINMIEVSLVVAPGVGE